MSDEQFIVARDEVREILPVASIVTRVPGARPWMRGEEFQSAAKQKAT
jgi:chemotaxis signal transduction protein